MSDLAVAVLVGRLTKDAELKILSAGMAVCSFSVATSSRKKKGDQWVDEASFWDIDYWGKAGEAISKYLIKGKQVAVEGTLRQDRWEKDGQNRSKTVITANTVRLLGSSSVERGNRVSESSEPVPSSSNPGDKAAPMDDFVDDVPF